MKLQALPLQVDLESTLPESISQWVQIADDRMQQFWDSFSKRPIEQYVACDFDYVAKALYEIDRQKLLDGNRFCEWGCGFGIVAGIASLLGWDAVGIEAEPFWFSRESCCWNAMGCLPSSMKAISFRGRPKDGFLTAPNWYHSFNTSRQPTRRWGWRSMILPSFLPIPGLGRSIFFKRSSVRRLGRGRCAYFFGAPTSWNSIESLEVVRGIRFHSSEITGNRSFSRKIAAHSNQSTER